MKKNNSKKFFMAIILGIILGHILANIFYSNVIYPWRMQKIDDKVQAMLDEIQAELEISNKNAAIKELSELKGRVTEIMYLNWSYAAQTSEMNKKFLEHLEDISNFTSINKQLEGFELTITESEVGAICEELISQIDEELSAIIYGTNGA